MTLAETVPSPYPGLGATGSLGDQMPPTEDELSEIEAAALAVEERAVAQPGARLRVRLGRGGFVSMAPEVARRLVAAIRAARSSPAVEDSE